MARALRSCVAHKKEAAFFETASLKKLLLELDDQVSIVQECIDVETRHIVQRCNGLISVG